MRFLQKLVNDLENFDGSGEKALYKLNEQPLYIHKGQVKLVDPSDKYVYFRSKFDWFSSVSFLTRVCQTGDFLIF